VLQNPVVLTGTASACFGFGTLIALTIFLPVYFESVLGLSASASGLALIPLTVSTVIGANIAGRTMSHAKHYKRPPLIGLAMAAAGSLVMAVFAGGMPLWLVGIVTALISLGLGTLLPVSTVAVQNAVAAHQLGTTTGAMNFFRQLGGALMVALFGAIVLSAGAAGLSLGAKQAAVAVEATTQLTAAFRCMFAAAALGFATSFALLLLMEEKPLRASAAPQRVVE
jgi:MFS family permease